KGRAVIRQLEAYLGEDTFRAGIRAYMAAHGYGNTTTADLWQALRDASGKPVADIAASFTEQPGLPLVVSAAACIDGKTRLTLSQDRFALRAPAALKAPWSIPIAFAPVGGVRRDILLQVLRATVDAGPCGAPLKINSGDVGYYRVQYDGE